MATTGYKETLNLPKTDFPLQANLVKMEPAIRERWEREKLYERIQEARRGSPMGKWILHDGPPYANGDVHVGTGQNKVLKDVVVKFRTMQGYYSPYVPGWDCHGLPIEHKVVKELGEKARTLPKAEIRARCETFARKYIDIQRRQFKALGVLGDWERPYLTIDRDYEVGIVEVFEELWKRGHIARRKKSIHWCITDRTALAEAELEYRERQDLSIFVAFETAPDTDLLVWTTTPWTLPGNVAVAVHPQVEYVLARRGSRKGWIAKPLHEKLKEKLGLGEILESKKGAELTDLKYLHPLFGHACPVVTADYVTVEDGTGLVHTAPGHGEEDYLTGLKHRLPIISPVDEGGYYTDEAKEWKGQRVFDANPKIVEALRARGTLLLSEPVTHDYPCCWRCKDPVIFRATEQWFILIDHNDGRARALEAAKQTRWFPAWGQTRMSSMLEQRPDWCVSRQRSWGVPIPALYCEKCGEAHISERSLAAVKSLFARGGANAWFTTPPKEFLPPDLKCAECGATSFRPETDIFDVWFESGSSHRAVLMKHPELRFPAEMYLEGTDQHRGWFQVSLLASLLSNGKSPFKEIFTHGFLYDARTGDKISKSGFLITGDEIANKHGADLLRLWICSIDFTDDIPFDPATTLQKTADPYKKIRNTVRYLLGNTSDFDLSRDAVPYSKMLLLDRWALAELSRLVREVTEHFDRYEYFRAMQKLYEFCVVTMSANYLDMLKDRLYTAARASLERRSAQTALRGILIALLKMYAPVLAHTCEEAWGYLPEPREAESVHISLWPSVRPVEDSEELRERFSHLLPVRNEVNRSLERLRVAGSIGKSLEARVTLHAGDPELLRALTDIDLEEFLIVSEAVRAPAPAPGAAESPEVKGLFVAAEKSPYPKCERCWNLRPTVGKSAAHPTLCERCVRAVEVR
jgi:isoleucyl-tRNA synthetase